MNDRTVHARWAQMEVIRYDRAGKWYLEPVGSVSPRQLVTLRGAVDYALWAAKERGGYIYMNQPGGIAFDRLVTKLGIDEETVE